MRRKRDVRICRLWLAEPKANLGSLRDRFPAASCSMPNKTAYDAVVVGSGPNGLSAAIRLAQAGLSVLVVEGSSKLGGACRSAEFTLPCVLHDVGSAVHPLAAASPFFRQLPLHQHGLSWVHPDLPLAHPLDDGAAAVLHRSINLTAAALGADARSYEKLMAGFVENWGSLSDEILQPLLHIPRHPLLMARFGLKALMPAQKLAKSAFQTPSAQALFAGVAAHSFLPLAQRGSAAFGLILGMAAHAVGWPIPRGGAQQLSNALLACLQNLGGEILLNCPVRSVDELPLARAVLLDVTPVQLMLLAGHKIPSSYARRLGNYRYGPGVFKLDYALSAPIPWKNPLCAKAGTVHVGGTLEEVARAEAEVSRGKHPEQPFVLLSQPANFDATRAPAGKHVLWAYCHVPNGSDFDMSERIERQIERFAPGFRDTVLARHTMNCAALEALNPNLVGGDINGGAASLWQLVARPVLSRVPYRTPVPGLYLCSSSTSPGGGVHGMCGFHAAEAALKHSFGR